MSDKTDAARAGAEALIATLKVNTNRVSLASKVVRFLEHLPDADLHIAALWDAAHDGASPFAEAVTSSWRLDMNRLAASVTARRVGERVGATRNASLNSTQMLTLANDKSKKVAYSLAGSRPRLPSNVTKALRARRDSSVNRMLALGVAHQQYATSKRPSDLVETRSAAVLALAKDLTGTNVPHESICAVLTAWFAEVDPAGWSREVWTALDGRTDTPSMWLMAAAAEAGGADPDVAAAARDSGQWRLRAAALRRPDTTVDQLLAALEDRATGVRLVAAAHPNTPVEALETLLVAGTEDEKRTVAARPDLTEEMRVWAYLDPTVPSHDGLGLIQLETA